MKADSHSLSESIHEKHGLDEDFLHEIVRQLSRNSLSSLLRFRAVNKFCENIGNRAIANTLNKTVDASVVFSNQNPLIYMMGEKNQHSCLQLHADIRRLLNRLEKIGQSHGDTSLNLTNFQLSKMRWLKNRDVELKRCSAIIQKRIKKLYQSYYQGTDSFVYDDCFLRPSRFLSIISKQSCHITQLNLGDIKNTSKLAMHERIFPYLDNLEVLVWTRAESKFVQVLPNPHRLKRISITFRRGHLLVEHIGPILNCQGLEHMYLGFRPPKYATRFDMEVLLNSYQLFWNRRNYTPRNMYDVPGFIPVKVSDSSLDGRDYCFRAFPHMKRIGFWNSPSSLFQAMCDQQFSYDTIQWGELNQDLNHLCSIDSVLESLFTYEAVQSFDYRFADHAKLYLHSMPVVSLEYYIPQLMALLGKVMNDVRSLELFIKSSSDLAMPSGWLMSGIHPRRCSPIFTRMTHFAFHIDNMCLLTHLDVLLPPTLTSLTLSFIVSLSSKKQFLDSLLSFIDKLDDINRFPDIEEFHVQIYGITSFETVLTHVIEVIPDLKKLSILCLPTSKNNTDIIELLKKTMEACKNLKSLSLCPSLINRLTGLSECQPADFFRWKAELSNFYSKNNLVFNQGSIAVSSLPVCTGFDNYVVPAVNFEENCSESECAYDVSEREKERNDGLLSKEYGESISNDEDEENDSFVVDDSEVESEEDELDLLEKALEKENERFFKKDASKRRRVVSERESTDEEDVIVFKAKRKKVCDEDDEEEHSQSESYTDFEDEAERDEHERGRCPFLDVEAEEDNEVESETETEEEPFLEELESDTEDCVRHAVEVKNSTVRSQIVRRKKIIDSDSE